MAAGLPPGLPPAPAPGSARHRAPAAGRGAPAGSLPPFRGRRRGARTPDHPPLPKSLGGLRVVPPPGVFSVPQVGAGGRGGFSAASDDDDATWRNAQRSRVAERSLPSVPLYRHLSPAPSPDPAVSFPPLPRRQNKNVPADFHQFSNSDEILSIHWQYQVDRRDVALFFSLPLPPFPTAAWYGEC